MALFRRKMNKIYFYSKEETELSKHDKGIELNKNKTSLFFLT